jgi:hypothetical protein
MFYMTEMVVLPIGILWLLGLAALVRAHWKRISEVYGAIKAKLAAAPEEEKKDATKTEEAK